MEIEGPTDGWQDPENEGFPTSSVEIEGPTDGWQDPENEGFPTSLEHKETFCKYHNYSHFRHAQDYAEREAAYLALHHSASGNAARRGRYADCGTNAWLQRNLRTGEYRVSATFCHDRWCPACQRARRRTITATLTDSLTAAAAAAPGHPLTLLTLTIRHTNQPLRDQISHLRRSFGLLRRRAFFDSRCIGGITALELKFNHGTYQWHPHLHVLMLARYIPQAQIVTHWHKITTNSQIVHLKRIPGVDHAVSYISKYVTKPGYLAPLPTSYAAELIDAMHGAQTHSTFGCMRASNIPEKAAHEVCTPDQWLPVEPLTTTIQKSNDGDAAAAAALRQLGILPPTRPSDGQHEMEYS